MHAKVTALRSPPVRLAGTLALHAGAPAAEGAGLLGAAAGAAMRASIASTPIVLSRDEAETELAGELQPLLPLLLEVREWTSPQSLPRRVVVEGWGDVGRTSKGRGGLLAGAAAAEMPRGSGVATVGPRAGTAAPADCVKAGPVKTANRKQEPTSRHGLTAAAASQADEPDGGAEWYAGAMGGGLRRRPPGLLEPNNAALCGVRGMAGVGCGMNICWRLRVVGALQRGGGWACPSAPLRSCGP